MTTLHQIANLHYLIKLPDQASPEHLVPAAILIHGWRGDETVMRFFDQVIPENVAIIRPRAPIDLPDEAGYGWFDTRGLDQVNRHAARIEAIDTLIQFLKRLPEEHPLDPNRLLLIGFSQGGIMSNYVTLTHPELLIGNAPLAAKVSNMPQPLTRVAALDNFPVFIAHGVDDAVIPIEDARTARDLFSRLNANVTYGEYAVGHKMNTQAVKNLKAWVLAVFSANA